jgi:4-hydroxybenzoate polyprenyltransferase
MDETTHVPARQILCEQAVGLVRISYPTLLVTPLVAALAGGLIAHGRAILDLGRLLGAVALIGVLYTLVSVLDDYYDWRIDRSHSPDRPLPRGYLTGFDVTILFLVLMVAGLVASLLLGGTFVAFFMTYLVASFAYSHQRVRISDKGVAGNLLFVSLTVPVPMLAGALSLGTTYVDWIFGLLVVAAFVFALGVDLPKDLLRLQKDETETRRPAVQRTGARGIRVLSVLCVLIGTGMAVAINVVRPGTAFGLAVSILLVMAAGAVAVARALVLGRRSRATKPAAGERFLWAVFSMQLVLFLAGLIVRRL